MRVRYIKPGFFMNEVLASLHPLTRILFAGLWCSADREGRLEERPVKLKATLLPYDDHDVEAALEDLERSGFIIRYVNDGQRLLQIVNWKLHQHPHPREVASSIPAPSARKKTRLGNAQPVRDLNSNFNFDSKRDSYPPQLPLGPPPADGPPEVTDRSEPVLEPVPEPTGELPPFDPQPPWQESRPVAKPQEVIYRHWEERLCKPHLERPPPEAWKIIGARLKEGMTVQMGCAVVDGAAIDAERWPERKTNDGLRYLFGSMDQVLKFADLAAKGNPKPAVDIEKIRRGNQRAEDQGWNEAEKRAIDRSKIL